MKKLLAILLTLCMVFTWIPAVARAEEVPGEAETDRIVVPVPEEETDKEFPETGNNRIEIPFQINPLYEGLVNEADLEIPEIPEPDEIVTNAATFQSEENAAKTIRSNMKNRTETYTVYVYSTNRDYNALFLELLNNAVVHTGVGTEGDYLMWHLAGWGGEVSIAESGEGYNYTYTYVTLYYTTAEQEQEVTTAVNNLINSLGIKYKSDYEKVCAVYDWICANVTYDHANLEDSSYTLKFSAYAALVNKTAVCQGYALLFYRLMLELGVDARFIGGDGGGPHAWNIVQLGDYYYTVDATWDAGRTDYEYFLKSTWNFVGHSRDPEFDYWEFHMNHPMAAEDYVHGGTATLDPYISMGYCGTEENGYLNAAWAMMRNGTLLIAGEGATLNYSANALPYWYYWMDHIEKAEIYDGITKIGDYAFYELPSLTAVATASSVEEIGAFTFAQCDALRQLVLSEGLVTIGKSAFYDCNALNEVTFPSTLKAIQERAFMYASGMTAINLPQGLTTLGSNAFSGCTKVKSVYVPSSVTSIGTYAFSSCSKLEKAELHCGTVREYMFSGCSALTDIVFGSEVNTVQSYAFNNCDALTTVNYPARLGVFNGFSDCDGLVTLSIPEGITEIGEYAFEGCDNLSSVTFPKTLKRINGGAFSKCNSLNNITFNEGLEYIGEEAFYQSGLTEIRCPDTLTVIDEGAFSQCSRLASVTFTENLKEIGSEAFKYCPFTEIVIPSSITFIGRNAFYKSGLTTLVLSEGLTRIDSSAFSYCDNLTEVSLPSSLEYFNGFSQCAGLTSIILPEGLTEIGDYALADCDNLVSVTIPSSVTIIGDNAFSYCPKLESLKIPEGITEIPDSMAMRCESLTEVIIPDTVTTISRGAFVGCESLTSVILPDGLKTLGSDSFSQSGLTEIVIPKSVTTIGGKAFMGCKQLEKAVINGKLGIGAFEYCPSLKYVELPNTVTELTSSCFAKCYALESIVIPESVTSIGTQCFSQCSGLKEIIFRGNAPMIYTSAFDRVTATAYYPQGNTTWTEAKMKNYGGTITWVSYAPPCTDHTYNAVVTAPTCSEQGYTTYTCTNCGHSYVGDYTDPVDHVYEDGCCKWCDEELTIVEWVAANATLTGSIDLNFSAVLSDNLVNDGTFVRFTCGNKTVDVPIADAVASVKDGQTRYRFGYKVYAKEMTQTVTAQVMTPNGPVGEAKSYSVAEYCNALMAATDNEEIIAVCKAMLNYGAAAQMQFSYNLDNLANASLSEEDKIVAKPDASAYVHKIVGTGDGIKAASAKLTLDADVAIRVTFQITGGKDVSEYQFLIDGEEAAPVADNGRYYIQLDGIAASKFDETHIFSVGDLAVHYSVLSYVNMVHNSNSPENLVNLINALYAYYAATEAYVN